ncbi:MAG: N-acetyltransferase [Actinobacteria bacterium]|nr:N-acetyltransferase [Actinomycetota bacterium]
MIIENNVIIKNNVHIKDMEKNINRTLDNSIIRSGTIIYENVEIGSNFKTGHNVLIRENTKIGDNVLIGTNSVLDGNCKIGDNVSIQTGVYITKFTIVKDNVFFGPNSVTTNDKYMKYGEELKGAIIKKGARIGANATILPGIVIGENSIVGAGAVVTKNVKENDVVVGNPAVSITKNGRKI